MKNIKIEWKKIVNLSTICFIIASIFLLYSSMSYIDSKNEIYEHCYSAQIKALEEKGISNIETKTDFNFGCCPCPK